jgi:hypothetical protein
MAESEFSFKGKLPLLYGLQTAAGLGTSIYGFRQAGLARDREAALRQAGMPQMSTAQEYFDLYQNASRSKQFEQEKAMNQSILASNLATLQGAGSRAVIGGAGAAQLTAQRGMAQAAETDFARQQDALSQLAQAQQQTNYLNFQARAQQYATDLAAARDAYTAGIETGVDGLDTAIGGAVDFAGSFKRKKKEDPQDPFKLPEQDPIMIDPSQYRSAYGAGDTVDVNVVGGTKTLSRDLVTPPTIGGVEVNFGGQVPISMTGGSGSFGNAQGGSITTPGKYTADHSVEYDVKTKGGKTIATVTGDETLVFNPKQRSFLKRVIGRLIKGQTIKPSKADTKTANETLKAFKK